MLESLKKLRADLFYFVGPVLVFGALFMFVIAAIAGQLTWMAVGIIAANIGGGTVMYFVGRFLRRTGQ